MRTVIKKIIFLVIATYALAITSFGNASETSDNTFPEEIFPELKAILDEVPRSSLKALIAEAQIDEAEGARIVSKSHLYPHLHGDYNLIYALQVSKGKDSTAQFLPEGNVTATQPLYHWGGLTAEKQIGEMRKYMSFQRYEQAMKLFRKELSSLYMSIFLQKKYLAITNENRKSSENDLKDSQHKFKLGQLSATQLEEKEINHKETELRSNQEEQQLSYSIEKFRHISQHTGPLLQEDPNIHEIIKNIPNWKPSFPQGSNQQSYAGYFLQNELSIERLNYKKIRASQLPHLNFQARFLHEMTMGTKTTNSVAQYEFFAGANIHWDVFSGFSTEGDKISSKARQRKLRLEMERTQSQFDLDKSNTECNLEFLYRRIDISKERFLFSEKNLETHKSKLEQGQISILQYGSAQDQKKNSECQLFASVIDYLNNLNSYDSLTTNQ